MFDPGQRAYRRGNLCPQGKNRGTLSQLEGGAGGGEKAGLGPS